MDNELAIGVCQGADRVVHHGANAVIIPSMEDPLSDCMPMLLSSFFQCLLPVFMTQERRGFINEVK